MVVVYYVDDWGHRVPESWLNNGGHEWYHRVEEYVTVLPDLCGHCDANLGVVSIPMRDYGGFSLGVLPFLRCVWVCINHYEG